MKDKGLNREMADLELELWCQDRHDQTGYGRTINRWWDNTVGVKVDGSPFPLDPGHLEEFFIALGETFKEF